jgi:sigma-E factor negative regulatory protein RseC
MYENAKVIELKGPLAAILVDATATCNGCTLHSCTSRSSRCDKTFLVVNSIKAKPGDRVEIAMSSFSFLTSAFLVYLVPVVALIIGFASGEKLAPLFTEHITAFAALCGFGLMALTFALIYGFNRWYKGSTLFLPRTTRVLP